MNIPDILAVICAPEKKTRMNSHKMCPFTRASVDTIR